MEHKSRTASDVFTPSRSTLPNRRDESVEKRTE